MREKLFTLSRTQSEAMWRRFKQTDDHRIAERLHAILLLDGGQNAESVSQILHIHPKTLKRIAGKLLSPEGQNELESLVVDFLLRLGRSGQGVFFFRFGLLDLGQDRCLPLPLQCHFLLPLVEIGKHEIPKISDDSDHEAEGQEHTHRCQNGNFNHFS